MEPERLEAIARRFADAPEGDHFWFESRRERHRRGGLEKPSTVRERSIRGGVFVEGKREFSFSAGHPNLGPGGNESSPFGERMRDVGAAESSVPAFAYAPAWEAPLWASAESGRLIERHTRQEIWVVDRRGVHRDVREGCHQRYEGPNGAFDRVFGTDGHPKPWPDPAETPGESQKPGPTTAIFAPGVAGIVVHELVGHPLEGNDGSTFASFLPPSATSFSVTEDPRLGRVGWSLDDEGRTAGASPLVVDGRVAGGLHDRRSGERYACGSTGSGRRSAFRERVRPRMGCTFLEPGRDDPDALLADVKRGVSIERIESGWLERARSRGWFRVARASRIERGRTTVALRPFMVTIDAPAWWETLDGVGNDLAFDTVVGACYRFGQPLAASVGAPTCRQRLLTVAS